MTAIRIVDQNLSEFPEQILNFHQLEEINLEGNNLLEIPSWLQKFSHLDCLFLRFNKIQTIPDWIFDLKLKGFAFQNNPLIRSFGRGDKKTVIGFLEICQKWNPDYIISKLLKNTPIHSIDKNVLLLGHYHDYILDKIQDHDNDAIREFRKFIDDEFRVKMGVDGKNILL